MVSESKTKTRIFDTALRLFAAHGYENVSVRMIADAVGIKPASMYNHYGSKEKILDACYDFYLEHRHETRLTREQYEPILRNGTKEEVLRVLHYEFPKSIQLNMILALSVITARMGSETKAKEIYTSEINNALHYVIGFFNLGIEIGRFRAFNVLAVALIIFGARMLVGQLVGMTTEITVDWSKAEGEMFDELLKIIPFAY